MIKILGSLFLAGQVLLGAEVYATFNVEAKQSSKLSLEVAGVVSKLNVDIGDKVSKGAVLLELDKEKEAMDLKLANNDLSLSQLSYTYANNSYRRYIQIKNVIDKEQFEKVELDKKLKYESIAQSTNALKRSKIFLAKRTLHAPYAGVITAKHIDVGDGVNGTSQVLLEMMASPEVKLVLSFDQKYWNTIKVGQTFKYKVDGDTTQREGKIGKIYPMVDMKNRKLQAEVLTKDIVPGLFGDGTIITE